MVQNRHLGHFCTKLFNYKGGEGWGGKTLKKGFGGGEVRWCVLLGGGGDGDQKRKFMIGC